MSFKYLPGLLLLLACSCSYKPHGSFLLDRVPPLPNYGEYSAWAALPMVKDSADLLPSRLLKDEQHESLVDVFFVHPTTYTGKRGHNQWNAAMEDVKLNLRTDKTSIRYQASLFNGVGRVYAPRYRQAHLQSFYTKKNRAEAEKALNLAYRDVRAAFTYYLEHYNEGRPIVIAAHSQGTSHAGRLLREFFEGHGLMDQLVVAYLVGMPVRAGYFDTIPACETPEQVRCFCSWRTVKDGFYPKKWDNDDDGIVVTNPLTWSTGSDWADRELHKGAVLKRFYDGPYEHYTDARVSRGFLWIPRPKIPGVLFLPTRNYHVIDYNLFYMNVRENAQLRTEAYFND